MTVAALISTVCIAWYCLYFFYSNRRNRILYAAFASKIAAGIALGFLYKFYYHQGDTIVYFNEAGKIADYILSDFPVHLDIFSKNAFVEIPNLKFHEEPRAMLFVKLLSLMYLLTGGNYWLMAMLLSIINFLCVKQLVDMISERFPHAQRPAVLAFYFLPTFVFWTSGLLKESLAIGALCLLAAQALALGKSGKVEYWRLGIIIPAIFVLWGLKYFYAAVALPVLFSAVVFERIHTRKLGAILSLAVLLLFMVTVSFTHYNLGFERILDVVFQNYRLSIEAGGGAIRYFGFDGSVAGFLMNFPLALFSGLFRPLPFEISNWLQFIVSLEYLAIMIIVILAFRRSGIPKIAKNPWLISALIFILVLDVFIAFSTPNFGTLSRYKAAYWPFFVMLVLNWYWHKNKSQASRDLAVQ